jgi:hypothetical protein
MLTITETNFRNRADNTYRRDRRETRTKPWCRATGNFTWTTILQFCAVALVVLGINFAMSLRAAPSQSELGAQPELVSQGSQVDRSRKTNRISPAAPAIKTTLLPGCEPPFSSLAKLSSSALITRCLT